jgi:hypothetical protein
MPWVGRLNVALGRAFIVIGLIGSALVGTAVAQQLPPRVEDAEDAPACSAARNPVVADGERQLAIVPRLGPAHVTPASKQSAYLMVYFKDDTHSLYFATSRDGHAFTDVNAGRPILSGRSIADQKGVRDPHIMRGPDGAFYMAMTDLHVFGQRDCVRTTQWERPEQDYGWGNNRNMLLMKSVDLLHWTLAKVDVSRLFPAYSQAGNAWAPETIYNPKTRRMMVYFTTRIRNGPNFMVSSEANAAFTTLTTTPRKILDYPRPQVNTIDADITLVGGKYRMFYVAHEKPGSIRQAVSNQIDRGYVYDARKIDPETVAAEAPNLWRRHGTNTWVLMYDVFGVTPNNMGFAETTDFVTFRNIGRFNDPGSPMKATNFVQPKHGTVMAVTPHEAARLERYFGGAR